jgi:anti-anti-sigma factor
VLAIGFYYITGLGVSVGLHRYFTHGSFKAARGFKIALAIAGSLAIEKPHLLLDLAGLRFCDCAGLSVFLRLRQRVMSAGGSLHLTAPTAGVRRLLVLTGLHDLLPIADAGVSGGRSYRCVVGGR